MAERLKLAQPPVYRPNIKETLLTRTRAPTPPGVYTRLRRGASGTAGAPVPCLCPQPPLLPVSYWVVPQMPHRASCAYKRGAHNAERARQAGSPVEERGVHVPQEGRPAGATKLLGHRVELPRRQHAGGGAERRRERLQQLKSG